MHRTRPQLLIAALIASLALTGLPTDAADAAQPAARKRIVQKDHPRDAEGDGRVAAVDFQQVVARRVGNRLQIQVEMGAIQPRRTNGYFTIDFVADGAREAYVHVGDTPDGKSYDAQLRVEDRRTCDSSIRLATNARTRVYTVSFPLRCLGRGTRVVFFLRGFSDGAYNHPGGGATGSRDQMTFRSPNSALDVRR